jgi:orotate phosphoribosyltransferase
MALVVDHGQVYELGSEVREIAANLEPDVDLVGTGAAGVLIGAAVAAVAGRNFAFCRAAPKDHGLTRQVEGLWQPGRPSVLFTEHEHGATLARSAGISVARVVPVALVPAADALAREPNHLSGAPAADVDISPGALAELVVGGQYTRSSGETASFYWETLGAAHNYQLAAAWADRPSLVGIDAVAGIMWGGCYVAAVAAARIGARLLLVDPDAARPDVTWLRPPRDVAFVDDLVNSGTDMRLCERMAAHNGSEARFLALYSMHETARLEAHDVDIAHRLSADPNVLT